MAVFPIVGLGASAGGLEALTQLFGHLPGDSGVGFVIIMHLEPRHKSELSHILSRVAKMPVLDAEDGMRVRPDHVFVLPPDRNLSIKDGVLHLEPRQDDLDGLNLPINHFMSALAADRKAKSLGVILSGTGSDGTQGLAEIKTAGGITFAQDPSSARHPGMAQSAIGTGMVDFILEPEELALELVRIARHPRLAAAEDAPDDTPFPDSLPEAEADFARIIALLHAATGVDFTGYRETTLKRRILRRVVLSNRDSLGEYARQLEADRPEIDTLYQDILINVTRFFRDPQVFEALKAQIFPEIHKDKRPPTDIRVWVAGCATGEEAYSLAMALLEFQEGRPVRPSLRIFASDVDARALDEARLGIYPESIEADVSPGRLLRFFTKEDGRYRVRKSLRDLCVFAKHDMTTDPPFSRLDLISCRNVLIYLSPSLQRRVLSTFHYALNPAGFLLLGTSETVGRKADLFGPVDGHNKIYARKMAATKLPSQVFGKEYPHGSGIPPDRPQYPSTADFEQAADRLLLRRYSPPGVLVNKDLDILQFRGRTAPFLEPPQGEATLNLVKMAHESLFLPLRDAIQEADEKGAPVRKQGVRMQEDRQVREVDLEVLPIKRPDSTQTCFLILFEESAPRDSRKPEVSPPPSATEDEPALLRQELLAAREYLRSLREQYAAVNEELRSSNEEILSSNEELQSTNEELGTAKEEMESANEELTTMNDELKNRNQELDGLNNDLNNLLNSIRLPLLMLGEDLRVRRFTPQAGKILGLGPAHIGHPFGNLSQVLQEAGLTQSILNVLATMAPLEKEVRDLNGRWFLLRIHPYRTSENRIEGAVLTLNDIDDLKRTQDRLREAAEYAQSIVDTVREPLLVLDGEIRIKTANPSFYRTFQVSPEATEGISLYQLGNGQWNIPALRALLDRLLPNDTSLENFEVTHTFPELGQRVMVLNARRLVQREGSGPLILLAIEDLTEKKRAERELQLFKFICDQGNDPYFLMNREARFLYANRSAYTRLGYGEAEILTLSLADVDPAQAGEVFTSRFDLAQTERIPPFESMHRTRTGEQFPVEYTVTGLLFKEEALLLAVVRDITGPRQAAERLQLSEEKLRQSQKVEAIGKLAGGIAHDFNNLLTAINGYSDLSLAITEPEGPLHGNLMEIHKAGTRAASLTHQLLAYSRKQVLAPKILSLNAIATDMRNMLERLIGEDIELRTALDPALATVKADPVEMEQVIVNLVVNARDAIHDGGKITIETQNVELDENYTEHHPLVLPGAYVLLAVTDTGSGMDAEVKARIFDPFFTTKGLGKGSGLGLSMVQGIVSQSGGHIFVYSEPGKGSTFKIYLPLAEEGVRRPEHPLLPRDNTLRGSETVLLVEDEDTVRTFARKILEMHGYTVLEAPDGISALALQKQHQEDPIHLLLTDVIMPGMNGKALAERFTDARPESRVLFMSGYTDDAIIRHGFLEAGTHFIQKPFTPTFLVKAVRKVLDSEMKRAEKPLAE